MLDWFIINSYLSIHAIVEIHDLERAGVAGRSMYLRSNEMSSSLELIVISSFAALECVPAPRVYLRRLFQSMNVK